MTIAASGPISLFDIADEVGLPRSGINMGAIESRLLAQQRQPMVDTKGPLLFGTNPPNTPISFSDYRGKTCKYFDFIPRAGTVAVNTGFFGFATTDSFHDNFTAFGNPPVPDIVVKNARLVMLKDSDAGSTVLVELRGSLPINQFYAIQCGSLVLLTSQTSFFTQNGLTTVWQWSTGGPPRVRLGFIPGVSARVKFYW